MAFPEILITVFAVEDASIADQISKLIIEEEERIW
jgi:hypothetical protein